MTIRRLLTAVINNQKAPAGVRARVDTGVRFEPVNIMKYIVKNDRDWTGKSSQASTRS